MNCRETVDRLYSLLDRELSEAEVREVHHHLEMCPPCVKYFSFQVGVKRLVKRSCTQESASLEFRARLGQALRDCDASA
jgi:mycothiol system anti-sigma-R factor